MSRRVPFAFLPLLSRPGVASIGLAAAVGLAAVVGGCGDKSSSGSGGSGAGGAGAGPATGGGGTNPTGGGGGSGGSGGTGGSSGGSCVGAIPPDSSGNAPMKLGDTGLYHDISTGEVSTDVAAYAPAYALWADDAGKNRWAYIPDCAEIDNTNEDYWEYPAGTRFWKEFAVDDGLGGQKKIETRMIEHYAEGPLAWLYVTYAWNDTGTDATLVPLGMEVYNALGTDHDIPAAPGQCVVCHGTNQLAHVNGFQAVQLSGPATGLNIAALSAAGLLKVPNAAGYPVPGAGTPAQDALGYLNANCGHCHNEAGVGGMTGLRMRLRVADLQPGDTDTYTTGVNVLTEMYHGNGTQTVDYRIKGGDIDPNTSCVYFRMSQRGDPTAPMYQASTDQMPPNATKYADTAALDNIAAWILTLPAPP